MTKSVMTAVCGFSYTAGDEEPKYYAYVKDALGNVIMIEDNQGAPIIRYEYDSKGRYTVKGFDRFAAWNVLLSENESILDEVNPFKWKSYYRDKETGYYYINGRYYDPEAGVYLDAEDAENLTGDAMTVGGLDRNAITLDNHIDIAYNDDNIFTSSKLYPDPLYDPNENKTWWELHWFEFIQNLVFTIALFVSVVLAACGHPQMLIFCIKAALIAAVSGAIIAGAITAYKGGDTKDVQYAIRQGAVDGFKSGFSMAAIAYGISSAVKALANMKGAPNKAKANRGCPGESECFKEGTLVQTEDGLKPIEDIQVGDMVLAYDEETGEQAYKPVKQLFRNTTKEWHHILVNGEEIVCTAGHPFYDATLDKFVCARDLKVGNKLLLSDGSCGIIEAIQVEQLEQPETTYNFEVVDFHTYYVSKSKILVHNVCKSQLKEDTSISRDIEGEGKYGSYEITYESGNKYIGKGGQERMWQSAAEKANRYKDKVKSVKWRPSELATNKSAFIQEAQWMKDAGWLGKGTKGFYNEINSPGLKFIK